jgi:hypothetical protein
MLVIQSILTMANLFEYDVVKKIEQGAAVLFARRSAKEDAPMDTEIVLEIVSDEGDEEAIAYYMASMLEQRLFWFEKVPATLVTGYERAVVSQAHLGKPLAAVSIPTAKDAPNSFGCAGSILVRWRCEYLMLQFSMCSFF